MAMLDINDNTVIDNVFKANGINCDYVRYKRY